MDPVLLGEGSLDMREFAIAGTATEIALIEAPTRVARPMAA